MDFLIWFAAIILGAAGMFWADAPWLCNIMILIVFLLWGMLYLAEDENHSRKKFIQFSAILFQIILCFIAPLVGNTVIFLLEGTFLIFSAVCFAKWWNLQTEHNLINLLFNNDEKQTSYELMFYIGLCWLINLCADFFNGVWFFCFSLLFWSFVLYNSYKLYLKSGILLVILLLSTGVKFLFPVVGINLELVSIFYSVLFSASVFVCHRKNQTHLLKVNSVATALLGLMVVLISAGGFEVWALILTVAALSSYILGILLIKEYLLPIISMSLLYSFLWWISPVLVACAVWLIFVAAVVAVALKYFYRKYVPSYDLAVYEPEKTGEIIDVTPINDLECSVETLGQLTKTARALEAVLKRKGGIPDDEKITLGQLLWDSRIVLGHREKLMLRRFIASRNRTLHYDGKVLSEQDGKKAVQFGQELIACFSR